MKIIIAGVGKVGSTLTRQLSASGYDITLIDVKQQVLEANVEKYDVMAVLGNCATMETLLQAGVNDADLLIAMTGADELNLLCSMTAHGINPNIHTIARICNPDYTDQVYKMQKTFALSLTVNPEKQAAIEIERLLKFPGFLKRDSFAKGRVEIVELRVDERSRLCNVALSELNRVIKCRVLVCAVLRRGDVVAPDGSFVLREGDRIFVTASTEILATLLDNLGIITKKVNHVMICGGGRVSYYLAQQLEKDGMTVRLIEKDPKHCEELAALLPKTEIINDDASNTFVLKRENIESCDALVTATGMDELNMIISLYGTKHGVSQVITKLGHMENGSMIDQLPIGSTIWPKDLCCNGIVRYIRAMHNQTGAAVSVHSIADGKAEAIEFHVEEKKSYCDKPLKNMKVKQNILVACITHGGVTELPGGDSVIREGDTVVVVTTRNDIIYKLDDIFEA